MPNHFTLHSIAIAHTPFLQKFAIPRQAGLLDIPAQIELFPPYNQAAAVKGLELVSHIWLSFIFHQHLTHKPQLQVRPPRLGGNEKVGVFATRSSFRPNAMGQSVVKLERIEQQGERILLHVRGLDVLDGTPIVDIKPYLPYADAVPEAHNHLASEKPDKNVQVIWHQVVQQQLEVLAADNFDDYQRWISDLIAYDPRPAYRSDNYGDKESYALRFYDLDIHWTIVKAKEAHITAVYRL